MNVRGCCGGETSPAGTGQPRKANGLGDVHAFAQPPSVDLAAPLYRLAIHYNELAYGRAGHVNIAWSYSNLGTAYLLTQRWEEARPHYEQGLEIAEAVVGKEQVAYATIEMNLAQALMELGEVGRFESLVQHAAATLESILGKEHMRLTLARRLQAFAAFMNDRPEEAERLLWESIRVGAVLMGPRFESVGRGKVYLGDLMAATGRELESQDAYREAVDILGVETAPGDDLRQRLEEWGVSRSVAFAHR